MKTAVIYSRVSTTLQDAESQNKELIDICRKNNYNLLAEPFTETISGITKADSRKQFSNLISFVEVNKPDLLLVWEISRLGRKTKHVLETMEYFNDRKINIYLKKENLYTLNEDGTINKNVELLLTIMASISSVERTTTMERSLRGLRDASQKGHWLGGRNLPYGYKRAEDKMLVIDEEESEIVKKIYDDYLSGKGTYVITQELNKNKIPTRFNKAFPDRNTTETKMKTKSFSKLSSEFDWSPATIYHILTNEIYIGKKRFKEEIFPAPSIIPLEVFKSVEERLTSNYNKKIRTKTHFYLLGNVKMKCGKCGRNYFANKSATSNQYICFSKRKKPDCGNNGINIDKLTYAVWYVLRDEQVLKEHIEKSLKERDINKEILDKEIHLKEVQKELTKLDKYENFLLDRVKDGDVSDNIKKRLNEVTEDRKIITDKLNNLTIEIDELKTYRDSSNDINAQIREIKGDKNKMKETLTKIIKSITFNPVENRIEELLGGLQDKLICVDVLLSNTPKPITFIITQRTQNIVILKDKEYDYESRTVYLTPMDIKKRKWGLHQDSEKKYLTQF